MEQLSLKNISLTLTEEGENIRVKSPGQNVLLASQNIENIVFILQENFKIVDSFYGKRMEDHKKTAFDPDDIHHIGVSIVLYYLFMYNQWRLQYKAKKYQDLVFKQDDFENPSTNDILIGYYKNKYPEDWEVKCSVLMAMELDELRRYYERRIQFYNK